MAHKVMLALAVTLGVCVFGCLAIFVGQVFAVGTIPPKSPPKLPPLVAIVPSWSCDRNRANVPILKGRVYNSSQDRTATDIVIRAGLTRGGVDVQRQEGVPTPSTLRPAEQTEFMVVFENTLRSDILYTGDYRCWVEIAGYKVVP